MEEFLKNLMGENIGGILTKILPTVLLIIVAYFVIKFIMKFVIKGISHSKLPKNVHSFASSTIKALLYFLVVLIVCGQ